MKREGINEYQRVALSGAADSQGLRPNYRAIDYRGQMLLSFMFQVIYLYMARTSPM